MKNIVVTLWVECLKVRKSKVFWLSLVFFVFVSFMMGLIVLVQKHPDLAQKLGMIGTKATMLHIGEANWQNYFNLLLQGISAIGLIGFGFVTSWIFGREYTENTVKDLLALPVSRSSVVLSKLIVSLFWCLLLAVVFLKTAMVFGYLFGLSDLSRAVFTAFIGKFVMITLLTILLNTTIAFFASYSRGFLLPFGIIILVMIISNFSGLIGLGPYFPWAIPGMLSVPAESGAGHLPAVSFIILITTSLAGLLGTIGWWQYSDQK